MRQTAWTLLDPRVAASSPPRPRSDMSPAPVAHPPSARTAASAGTLYLMRILDPGMASEAEMPTCVDGVKRVATARRIGLVALIKEADDEDRSTKRHLETDVAKVAILPGRPHGIDIRTA